MTASSEDATQRTEPSLFDLLAEKLSKPTATPILLPLDSADIGGELIAILSKGLYTNPLDCLREYAQNGVDAQAETITLKITGNTVMIFDDGVGMGLAELLEAKKFGLSPKSIAHHVGFRGIGIYSGFDLCRRLIVTSKRTGSVQIFRLVFEFAKMKEQLDKERNDPTLARTSLVDLLSAHTTIAHAEDGPEAEHYTTVELRDIQPEHIALLSDRRRLREYLLQNLPIAFAPSFSHSAAIDARLREAVPGYNPIVVKLQLDGQPEESVQKYGPTQKQLTDYAAEPNSASNPPPALNLALASPIFREVRNSANQTVAFYWACLNQARARLEPKEAKPQFEGFIYKVKGFSIGDRDKLRALFPREQLYPWFTGEVFVIDPHVVPNAERNDFETSAAKTALEVALLGDFRTALKPAAEKFQARAKAEEEVQKHATTIANLEADFQRTSADDRILDETDVERLTQLSNAIEDLGQRKRVLKDDPTLVSKAEDLTTRARTLLKAMTRVLENPGSEIAKRRKTAEQVGVVQGSEIDRPTPPPPVRLESVFADGGVDLSSQSQLLLEIFQGALDDLLPPGGPEYRRFIAYIAERLADNSDVG